MMNDLIHRGSVKDIYRGDQEGVYRFEYSDRYSVFDWGAMPDNLENKGKALAFMADFFFRQMESKESWQKADLSQEMKEDPVYLDFCERGMGHHSLGLNNKLTDSSLSVRAVDVIMPKRESGKWNYSEYGERPLNTLVPLEVIFRYGLPEGSSLFKRINDEKYCEQIGLNSKPSPGDSLTNAIIEYSTKLEEKDRYISYDEAQKIAGLNEREFKKLHSSVLILSKRLEMIFKKLGVKLWDGKFEFAFAPELLKNGDRDFWVVDSIGPDELRLSYDGVQLSKQNLRNFYKGSTWESGISKAQEMAKERGSTDWKKICSEELGESPCSLTSEVKEVNELMYQVLADELAASHGEERPFSTNMNLSELSSKLKKV